MGDFGTYLVFGLFMLVCAVIVCIYKMISISYTRKSEKIIESDKSHLQQIGFKITKRILVFDFCDKKADSIAPNKYKHNGIWFDYEGKRIAIRAVNIANEKLLPTIIKMITTPNETEEPLQVFDFADIMDYEVLEGTTSRYSASAIGFGPFIIGSGRNKEFADDTFVRLVFGGTNGAHTISIQLYHGDRTKGGFYTNSPYYQAILNGAQAMVDELNNIMRIQKT